MRQLAWRLLAANLAGAVEAGAGLDYKLADQYRTADFAAGDDLQALGIDIAVEATADQHLGGLDFTFYLALLANGNLAFGFDRAFDTTIYMQVVAQGKVADQLCACSNDGRSGTLAVRRMTSTNDSHSTRSSLAKSRS